MAHRTLKEYRRRRAKARAHSLAKSHLENLDISNEKWAYPGEHMAVSKELFRIRRRLQKEIDRLVARG